MKAGYQHPVRIETIPRPGALPLLAILDAGDESLKIAGPTGGGGFGSPSSIGGIGLPSAMTTGDINGDGYTDIAITGGSDPTRNPIVFGTVAVYFGSGTGFSGYATAQVGEGPVDVSAGDLDGDGRDDLAVANASDGTLTVLRAIGPNGALVSESYGLAYGVSGSAIVDIDKDGKPDIVAGSPYSLYVVRNLSRLPPPPQSPAPSSCGNGARDADESCDKSDLGGQTCATVVAATAKGVLKCSAFCQLDLSGCSPSTPCGGAGSYQDKAPWPMAGRCPNHVGRSDQDGPQTGAIRWSYATGARALGGPAISAAGDVIFGSTERLAYNVSSAGTLKFTYSLSRGSTKVPAIAPNGVALLGGDSGFTDYLNVLTGAVQYPQRSGGVTTSATLGGVYANGGPLWGTDGSTLSGGPRFDADAGLSATPVIGADGAEYFGTLLGTLYSAYLVPYAGAGLGDPTFGAHWRLHFDKPILADMALSTGGLIYIPVADGTLKAVRPSGDVIWSTRLGAGIGSPAIAADGTIRVTTSDALWAVNPDGSIAWSLAGTFVGSTPSIGHDGTVYVGVDGSSLAAVSPTGSLLFKVVPPGAAAQSRPLPQPALGANNTAYYVAGGTLYAVGP